MINFKISTKKRIMENIGSLKCEFSDSKQKLKQKKTFFFSKLQKMCTNILSRKYVIKCSTETSLKSKCEKGKFPMIYDRLFNGLLCSNMEIVVE